MATLSTTPDVLILQETHLVERYSPKIQGYSLFRKDNSLHSGGLAIFVKDNLPATILNIPGTTSIEVHCISVQHLTFYNIYISPNHILSVNDLAFMNGLPKRTIILGDFNAYHQCWSTSRNPLTSRRGQILYEVIDKNELVILNTTEPTRINLATNAVNRWSLLDLTLATPDIASKCRTLVTDQLLGSDHYIIITTINSRVLRSGPLPRKWSWGRANWEKFSRLVDKQLANSTSSGASISASADEMNSVITSSLISAAEKSIPRTRNVGKMPVPWWNTDCERAIRLKKASYLKMKKSFKIEYVIDFKRRRSECRCTILKAKRQYWKNFCESLDINTNINKVWKISRTLAGISNYKTFPTLRSEDNETVTDDKCKADILADTFAKVSSSSNYPSTFDASAFSLELSETATIMSQPRDDTLNGPFTLIELKSAISSRKNSSPGHDKICYAMLKNLPQNGLISLLDLYNSSWSNGVVPANWKHSVVCPIPKSGKDPSDRRSYRPISLTSHIGKIMEIMVAKRLEWFLEANNLLHKSQSGFRHGRSTLDHVLQLHDTVYKSLINHRSVIAVFLDIVRAYDMVWRDGLIIKLARLGVQGKMLKWIHSLISNRSFRVRVGLELSDTMITENGIPQGSVISPLLFAVMVNDLPDVIKSGHGIYADDCAVWKSGTSIRELLKSLQSTLNAVSEWCSRWGFVLSKEKSVAMLFTRKRSVGPLSLTINGTSLAFVEEFKYLGIIFDRHLTYKYHIDYLVTKCVKRLNLLKLLSGTYWGAGKETLLIIYRTQIRSLLDFGMPAYFFASKHLLDRLQRIQNQALRICCGAMRSTPICVLQAACNEMPLDKRHQYLCFNYKAKLLEMPSYSHPARNLIADSGMELYCFTDQEITTFNSITKSPLFDQLNLEPHALPKQPPWQLTRPEVDLELSHQVSKNDLPNSVKSISIACISEVYHKHVKVYTDGSKSAEGAGFAFHIPALTVEKAMRCSITHSPFSIELLAIRSALSWISENTSTAECFLLLSDCLSGLEAIKIFRYRQENTLVSDIFAILCQIEEKGIKIVMAWIPGHVGIPGNEEADRIARNAATTESTSFQRTAISKMEAKAIIKQHCMTLWDDEYKSTMKGFQYKAFQPSIFQNPITISNRLSSSILFRLRSGHCRLNGHLHRIGIIESPNCDYCQTQETVEHFLLSCPQYGSQRSRLVQKASQLKVQLSMHAILTEPDLISLVVGFVLSTGKTV